MDQLDVAIENLYKSFSDVPAPSVIEGCPCCIERKNIDKLLGTNLRSISPDDLSSYASSAFLTVGAVPDYLYLVPRILEISIRDEWWWPSIEVTGRALRNTDVPSWPSDRRQVLSEFFMSVIKRFVENHDYDDLDDWMCGIARTGLDVRPFLNLLEENKDAVLHYVNENAVSLQKGKLSNAFWDPGDSGQDEIIAWLQSEKVCKLYSEASKSTN